MGLDMSHCIFSVLIVVLLAMETQLVMGAIPGNNGTRGRQDNGTLGWQRNGTRYDPATDYILLPPVGLFWRERALCQFQRACFFRILTCPAECPDRKPRRDRGKKGCFINCGPRCEATCKRRKPNCDGYGSVWYDPRFVGGDGVMFYFHGSKGGNYALVSDQNLHINAHFIGTRPSGRTRDNTWVQAISIMFDTHTIDLSANNVSKWDDNSDSLTVKWNGETINIPMDDDAEWRSTCAGGAYGEVMVERTDYTNSVRVNVKGLLEVDVKVVPIGKEENRVHNYQVPENDASAHLETQFRFEGLTDQVEGVLGKTYRPGYVSPIRKDNVAMPVMGGEDKYSTASLHSIVCQACKFRRPPAGYEVEVVP